MTGPAKTLRPAHGRPGALFDGTCGRRRSLPRGSSAVTVDTDQSLECENGC